ncbi:MAG: trypsin-like peptidase domain-containing protein [bacterium]|nr:trypsin-like peptidase domain-containing protein [bacterium]
MTTYEPSPAPTSSSGYAWAGEPPATPWAAANPPAAAAVPVAATDSRVAPRTRRVWPGILAASVLSATLASGATLGIVSANGGAPGTGGFGANGSSVVVPAAVVDAGGVAQVAAAVRDSVVAIEVATGSGGGSGSGVVVDAEGHILTNDHVVAGAAGIRVTLADGRVFPAQIVGTDPTTDLAVIALDSAPEDLVPAALGSSDTLSVGEQVVAVGNPLGLSSTVTAGIVSALDRPVTTGSGGGERVVTNAIQVDAAINPGNSGGPLFDLEGRVVGINSSIAALSRQSGSIGLGFAIPVDLASRVAGEIIATGEAQHAFLGVSLVDGEARASGVTRTGAEVREVVAGSAAEAAGIAAGDVVVSVDGASVTGADSLTGFVRAEAPGTSVLLGVVRGGEHLELEVSLKEA